MIDYEIDTRHGVVYVAPRGAVALSEYEGLLDAITEDARYDRTFSWVYDVSAAEPPTREEMQAIVAVDGQRSEIFRDVHQVIVAPTDVLFGMARVYEMIADRLPGRREVLRTLDEAKDRLGLPEDWRPPAKPTPRR